MNPVKRIKDYLEWKMHDIALDVALENYNKAVLSWPQTEENKRKETLFIADIITHSNICMRYMDKYHLKPKT